VGLISKLCSVRRTEGERHGGDGKIFERGSDPRGEKIARLFLGPKARVRETAEKAKQAGALFGGKRRPGALGIP
jgi:hypothetical protein